MLSLCNKTLLDFFIVLLTNIYILEVSGGCNLAEFECKNGQCVQSDKYCNRVADCRDKSDEPAGCTVCNRTYHGLVGFTYALMMHIPVSCLITFNAAGNSYGDIVQLSIPLAISSASNCTNPLEIREIGNPHHKSKFCAKSGFKSETLSNYYSDLNSIEIQFSSAFDVYYKFLPRTFYPNRGTLLQGTLCSILFENCHGNCTIQTPNFPGLYPNNSTCYYAIRETATPIGLRAIIKLSGQVHIGHGDLRYGDNCPEYVVVYDGYSIIDPILIKFCGNGILKEVTSSGHEMLVQFYSGDNGVASSPTGGGVKGLNLAAKTVLIRKDSYAYSENHNCLHTISSFEKMSGRLVSPVHSLPGNTTCTYYFQGRSSQRVWISFLKFSLSNGSHIEVWEQPTSADSKNLVNPKPWNNNVSLSTGIVFTSTNVPPVCEFKLMTSSRACVPFEQSFVSSSPQLTLKYFTVNGTVLEKSSFIIDYEFVQNGGDSSCSKTFRSSSGSFSSTRNVLLFGRAGRRSLRCVFRFEADRGQHVRLTLNRIGLKGRSSCISAIESITKRTICKVFNSSLLIAKLEFRQLVETTNETFPTVHDCFCGEEIRTNPLILTSTTTIAELVMSIENMGAQDDQTSFYFDGTYEMLNLKLCPEPHLFSQSTKMTLTKPSHCPASFYILPPVPHTFLSLKSKSSTCKPLILHTVDTQKYICLQYENTAFSPGWTNVTVTSYTANVLILELLDTEIDMNYLQVFSQTEPIHNYVTDLRDTCGGFKCSSINACIDKALFCNGIPNCPLGEDEASCNGFDYTLPLIVVMAIIIAFLSLWICCTRTERKGVG